MRLIETVLLLVSSPLLAQSTSPTPPPGRGVIEQAALTTLPRGGEDVQASAFVGAWALSDEQNAVFDAVLFEDGTVRTTWVKGSHGAEGEGGRWRIYGNGVRLDYDDGWIDVIRIGELGFEQVSYSPETPLDGAWSNHGKAVRIEGAVAPFVGVYRLVAQDGAPFAVALRSDGAAFKSIDADQRGLWRVRDGAAEILWADGWVNEIRLLPDGGVFQLAWPPDRPRTDAPEVFRDVARLRDGSLTSTAPTPSRSRAALAVDAASFAGAWALTDGENDTFNVVLFPGGAARSTWSKGASGSRGEGGRWRTYGSGVRIDYDSGWIDLIRPAAQGFEEVAFSPSTPISSPPTATGRATRVADPLARFVGVFELRAETTHEPFCVALQSNGVAFKDIPGFPPIGTWTLVGDAAVVQWSDGWIDEVTIEEDGRISQRTWSPGRPRSEPPSATAGGRRLRDGIPGPLRPAAPTPPPG